MLLFAVLIAATSGSDLQKVVGHTHRFLSSLPDDVSSTEPTFTFPEDIDILSGSPLLPAEGLWGTLRSFSADIGNSMSTSQVERSIQATAQCVVRGVWDTERYAGSVTECGGVFPFGAPNRVAVARVQAGEVFAMRFEVSGELISASGTVFGEHLLLESLHRKSALGEYDGVQEWEASRLFIDAFVSECAFGQDAFGTDSCVDHESFSLGSWCGASRPTSAVRTSRISRVGLPVPEVVLQAGDELTLQNMVEYKAFAQRFSPLASEGRLQIALQDFSLSSSLHSLVSLELRGNLDMQMSQILSGLSMELSSLPEETLAADSSLWVVFDKSLDLGEENAGALASPTPTSGFHLVMMVLEPEEEEGDSPSRMEEEYNVGFSQRFASKRHEEDSSASSLRGAWLDPESDDEAVSGI